MNTAAVWLFRYVEPRKCVFLSCLLCCSCLIGCGKNIGDALYSLRKDDPDLLILKENTTPSRQEIWWSISMGVAEGTVRGMAYSDNKYRDTLLNAETIHRDDEGKVGVERIYYVYISPSSVRQHEWNVETDAPNYVYRCIGDEITVLEQREGRYRDENNSLMPPDWRPTPPPWYDYFIDPVFFTYVIIAVVIGTIYFGRKYQRAQRIRSTEALSEPPRLPSQLPDDK